MGHLNQEGRFRAHIIDFGLIEADSGAVGVSLTCKVTDAWSGDGWTDWTGYEEQLAFGCVWVIKKDKSTNNKAVESLTNHAGWDGKFSSIVDRTWQATPIQIVVKAEEYKGEKQYKIAFVNDFNSVGTQQGVDAAKARQYDSVHGASIRALMGTAKRNATPPPANGPKSPPPAKQEVVPATSGVGTDADVPF